MGTVKSQSGVSCCICARDCCRQHPADVNAVANANRLRQAAVEKQHLTSQSIFEWQRLPHSEHRATVQLERATTGQDRHSRCTAKQSTAYTAGTATALTEQKQSVHNRHGDNTHKTQQSVHSRHGAKQCSHEAQQSIHSRHGAEQTRQGVQRTRASIAKVRTVPRALEQPG